MQPNYQVIKSNQELRWLSRNQLTSNWGNAILAVIIFTFINSAASSILIGPLTVGLSICFINLARYGRFKIENVFDGFKAFGTSFLAFLLKGLIIFFLSLLLIVPGIIAGLAYALTPFIINDNPGISATDALRMSREMMKGFKGKLFMMYLSFIGWAILSVCTCYIGFLWLTPYMQASLANFYENLRQAYGLPANAVPNLGNNNGYNGNFNNNNFNNNPNNNYNNNYNNNFNNNFNNSYNNPNGYNNMNGNNYNNANNPNYPNNVNNYNNSGNYNTTGNTTNYPNNLNNYNNTMNPNTPMAGNPNLPQNPPEEGIDKF